ncbi:lasso RiPP family leader peptide-containing protein [Paenibacillus thiaminolyticus]
MTNVVYSKPTIEKVASFKESTKGLWFGQYRDVFGAKAFLK